MGVDIVDSSCGLAREAVTDSSSRCRWPAHRTGSADRSPGVFRRATRYPASALTSSERFACTLASSTIGRGPRYRSRSPPENRRQLVDGYSRRRHLADGAGNLRSGGIVVGEARRRPRDVGVQREPWPWTVVVGPLHAEPAAGPSGFRRARIADEDELRVQRQAPDGDRRLHFRDEDRTHAELTAACAHERRHSVRRVARRWIDGDRRPSGIVAVVAVSEVAVQLDLRRRRKHDTELRAQETG